MIKILIITPDLKQPGGVSNFIKLLSKGLDENNFEIKYFFVGKTGVYIKDLFYPFLILVSIFRLRKILKIFQPDLVHMNPSLDHIAIIRDFIFLRIIKREGYPVLFFIHGWQKNISKKFKNIIIKKYFKKRFEMIDLLVVLANEFKKELIDLGINSDKVSVLSTMVETNKYLPKYKIFTNPYKILFCANMKKEKGPFELLDAVPLVIEKYRDALFILVGDGKDLEKLKEKAKVMGIEKYVNFTGFKTGNNKIELFKQAHIFVFPSHSEGFPTVILEAMAAGLPLITTKIGGLKDAMENGRQGLIINRNISNPKEIAEKINYLIKNPEIMKKMSENNIKESLEKYDHKIITKKIIEIYGKII